MQKLTCFCLLFKVICVIWLERLGPLLGSVPGYGLLPLLGRFLDAGHDWPCQEVTHGVLDLWKADDVKIIGFLEIFMTNWCDAYRYLYFLGWTGCADTLRDMLFTLCLARLPLCRGSTGSTFVKTWTWGCSVDLGKMWLKSWISKPGMMPARTSVVELTFPVLSFT